MPFDDVEDRAGERAGEDTLAHQATDTRLDSGVWEGAADPRVPGLTVLWHPDVDRIGHRVAFTGLSAGRPQSLARLEPWFRAPDGSARAPLADARISRQPILLRRVPEGLRLERAGSKTSLEVDGEPLAEALDLAEHRLDAGAVLLLGRRIVLLLHRMDPVLPPNLPHYGLIGESAEMVRLRQDISRVSDLDVSVLVRGKTGTGKELVARALHQASPRRDGPFVAVDMAAVPPSLAATELFGAARGAYTGADRKRLGHFQKARGGTLFLDEIGEAPIEVQSMLLRALETRTIQPVGSDEPVDVDVRLVSATDLDLEAAVGKERFKAPLLHRLAGFVLRTPALRERRDDLGRLWLSFLRRELEGVSESDRLEDSGSAWLAAPIVARLARYPWPGNVRQLANAARQLVIANRGEARARALRPLEDLLGEALAPGPTETSASRGPDSGTTTPSTADTAVGDIVDAASRRTQGERRPRRPADIREEELIEALRRNRFRPRDTAEELGIPRGSLYELMAKSPKVRKASELGAAEIEAALAAHDQSTEGAADALEVSAQALRRQMGKLGL